MSVAIEARILAYKSNISSNIKYLLDINSMNALALSKALKVSYSTIHGLINENITPTLETLLKAADYFKISLTQILGDAPLHVSHQGLCLASLPIIESKDLDDFATNSIGKYISNPSNYVLTSQNDLADNSFCIINTVEIESIFPKGAILCFRAIEGELNKYENKLVITINADFFISVQVLIINNGRCYLKKLSGNHDPTLIVNGIKVIGYLIDAKFI